MVGGTVRREPQWPAPLLLPKVGGARWAISVPTVAQRKLHVLPECTATMLVSARIAIIIHSEEGFYHMFIRT